MRRFDDNRYWEPPRVPATDWISEGEKYAFIGLELNLDSDVPSQLSPRLWALTGGAFTTPSHWREWLGSVRSEEIEACNLFLMSKLQSAAPEVLDGENIILQRQAWEFYVGLLLSSAFAPRHQPVSITGSRSHGEIGIRQHSVLDAPVPSLIHRYPAVTADHIVRAAHLAEQLNAIPRAAIAGRHWRLFRTLRVYTDARSSGEIIDRIHQYSRCIDGLIMSEPGVSRQRFKSRTEMFIGPKHHDMMGAIYDVRSAVEHLHEYRYLEQFDRDVRLDLVKKEAIAEHIARAALARVIGTPPLWGHFANSPALEAFWALPEPERRQLWGPIIDPYAALAEFDPQYINNGELGG